MLEIITDSASDIPLEIKEYYHLHVIPTPVVIDGEDYLDGETIRPSEFYEIQREGKREISTYHINPDMFEEAFRRYAEAGLLVYYLLRLREKGADREMLLEAAEYYREHIRHVFTVDTLEYLIRGGRITRGKGMVAETLSIRPVITVDEKGSLKILRLVRGTKKAYRALAEYVAEHGAGFENQPVAFCHGTVPEAVEELMGIMKSMGAEVKRPVVSQVGCAIGAHTGERIVGICFLDVVDRYGAFEEAAGGV